MKIRLRKVVGTQIGTSDGTIVGTIDDFIFDQRTGKIQSILAVPRDPRLVSLKKDENGRYIIPFDLIVAGKDYLVLDVTKLKMLR